MYSDQVSVATENHVSVVLLSGESQREEDGYGGRTTGERL